MMPQRMFRLNNSTMAVASENGQRALVALPAHAVVTVIVGDINGDGFIKIRFRNQVLVMLADDLRSLAQPVMASSA
jgi:hypothetical protein